MLSYCDYTENVILSSINLVFFGADSSIITVFPAVTEQNSEYKTIMKESALVNHVCQNWRVL